MASVGVGAPLKFQEERKLEPDPDYFWFSSNSNHLSRCTPIQAICFFEQMAFKHFFVMNEYAYELCNEFIYTSYF